MTFCFPPLGYTTLRALVESLPHVHETSHSRLNYVVEGFVDDLGNIVLPHQLSSASYAARYFHYKE